MPTKSQQVPMQPSPFDLEQDAAYLMWRDSKLKDYPRTLGELVVEIDDPRSLTEAERDAILQRCRKANMALYASATRDDPDHGIPLSLGRQFGLTGLNRNWLACDDGLTALTVEQEGVRPHYIPYTNRPIKWHTDGYYNTPEHQIRGLILHCVQPAPSGGENALMDHELAYILLRDINPEYIAGLMAPDAMTIPARLAEGEVARAEETGPVFSVDPVTGDLHMRYTERTRNILWKDDPLVHEAEGCLRGILNKDSAYVFRGLLEPGMGLVCNNVLHDRAGFTDTEGHRRLIYRARYYDRIKGTGVREAGASGYASDKNVIPQ